MNTISKTGVLFTAIESAMDYRRAQANTGLELAGEAYLLAVETYGKSRADHMVKVYAEKKDVSSTSDKGLKTLSVHDDAKSILSAVDTIVAQHVIAGLQGKRVAEVYKDLAKEYYWGLEATRSRICHCYVTAKSNLTAQDAFTLSSSAIAFESHPVIECELTRKMVEHEGYIDVAVDVARQLYSPCKALAKLVFIPSSLEDKRFVHPVSPEIGLYYIDGNSFHIDRVDDLDQMVADRLKKYIDAANLNPSEDESNWD